MKPDPIVEEVHRTRQAIAEKFDNDLAAITDDARRRQAANGKKIVQRPPRKPNRAPAKAS